MGITADMDSAKKSPQEIFFDHFRIRGTEASLEMLRAIVSCYADIPYENVTKIIRKFSSPRPEERLRRSTEVLTGYVEQHTGGTCFSLTYCLGSILSGAGFRCYPVMADMKRPNVHCALVTHLSGRRYLVDPGYILGEPVVLSQEPASVETSFGRVELRPRMGERYDLFTVTGNEKKWRYRVKTAPVSNILFMRYWQESFSLPMMNSLQLTRLTPEGHLYIRNHHLRLRKRDAKINENIRQTLESRIEAEFGIPGSLTAEAREYLEQLKQSWHTYGGRKG